MLVVGAKEGAIAEKAICQRGCKLSTEKRDAKSHPALCVICCAVSLVEQLSL
jgi:hypothetical protein